MDDAETTTPNTANKKKHLNIDFDELLGANDGEPVANLVVVSSAERRRRRPPDDKTMTADDGDSSSFAHQSDADLKTQFERFSRSFKSTGSRLPDKGAKIQVKLDRIVKELQRRDEQRRRFTEVADGCKNPLLGSSRVNGVLDVPQRAAESSRFASCFLKKLEGDPKPESRQNASNYSGNAKVAFEREFSSLNRCENQKKKANARRRANIGLNSEKFSPWEYNNGSQKRQKYGPLNLVSRPLSKENQDVSFATKAGSKSLSSSCLKDVELKEGHTVVLVDEEEPELVEKNQEVEEQLSRPNEDKIYYPSREDPESLEIFYSELKCLEPSECLTSTIMNFYIRFLRESSKADKLKKNLYFFNTYFYSKLQEAVVRQKSEGEAFFTKFRRWWKGVNIFEKAYIFLPINEDKHWSLVIICIPDDEESGLMILHLDSLGLHYSSPIFKNIKSLLLKEWEYLKEDGGVDVPIPDRIWERLPRKIDERTIQVPRQTNDYDCGLFVLYYMERFIHDAPGRLKRQDISKFDKKWFKSQEASSLRGKIKKILLEKFHMPVQDDNATWTPVCLTAASVTPKAVHCLDSS